MFLVQIHSLSVTAELIGQNCDSAAFIYGVMSLTDKFASGIVIMAVQSIEPSFEEECNDCASCHPFFAQVLFYACGGAALLGALGMLSLVPVAIGRGFRKEESALAERGLFPRNSINLRKFSYARHVLSYPAMTSMDDFDHNGITERAPLCK